ncbi:hypothetical protein Trydic_g4284 [Trypoxylus dichotomus]
MLVSSIPLIILLQQESGDILESCKCWADYEPRDHDGTVQCHSLSTPLTTPCNIPEAADCHCKEDFIFIMTDTEGKWCCFGVKDKRPCENVDEWNRYEEECNDDIHCIPNSNKANKVTW